MLRYGIKKKKNRFWLQKCPFKVLACKNPDCGRDSCRACKAPNHVPLRLGSHSVLGLVPSRATWVNLGQRADINVFGCYRDLFPLTLLSSLCLPSLSHTCTLIVHANWITPHSLSRCDEVESRDQESARKRIEEQLSEAMIRYLTHGRAALRGHDQVPNSWKSSCPRQ